MIKIIYQTSRKYIVDSFYYPEDLRTPKQRVEYMKYLASLDECTLKSELILKTGNLFSDIKDIVIVTSCFYIVKSIDALFKNHEKVFMIDDKVVEKELIYKEFAEPMQELNFL